jgi:hypothetical protein
LLFVVSMAPTLTTPGRFDGYAMPWACVIPAALTTRTPLDIALAMAASTTALWKLRFGGVIWMMSAPLVTAQSMPSATSTARQVPAALQTFTGSMVTFHAMPATPCALLPRAPTMPASSVPQPELP